MRDNYIYPAILTAECNGVSVEFPDLPGCLPCADNLEEAAKSAKEAMGLHLWGTERDGEDIPQTTEINKLKLLSNQTLLLVDVFMPPIRDRLNNKFVKKHRLSPNG
jgi:predicted RNase H-like HicB family nuclease